MKINHIFILIGTVIFISLYGCANRKTLVYNQPTVPQNGYYEMAWVDPQIISEDSLYTLISASHIDSFYVANPQQPLKKIPPSLTFTIKEDSCFVAISLLGDNSKVIEPLIVKVLPKGYYKVSINRARINLKSTSYTDYYLKAFYCGHTVIEHVNPQ